MCGKCFSLNVVQYHHHQSAAAQRMLLPLSSFHPWQGCLSGNEKWLDVLQIESLLKYMDSLPSIAIDAAEKRKRFNLDAVIEL